MQGIPILSIVTFLPMVGAILALLLPENQPKLIKYVALLTSVATLAASVWMFMGFRMHTYHFQLMEVMPWIPAYGINYRLGVDGISVWLVMLTTLLSVISIWFSFYVNARVKQYFALILFLETAMLGVFVAMDLILFFTFFEVSLIPMWLMISIWGGERRMYAGLKFFIYTFAGSIFMLIGMIWMARLHHAATGVWSYNIVDIQRAVANGSLWATALQTEPLVFWAFAVAFLLKCPAFPFHTWLPDAHVEAPTAGSIILAGVLLKMGTYGFLRFCLPLFPDALPSAVPWIMGLAVVGIIYGAIVAAVQPDLKKLIAYSSVAHMGFVLLGIFSLTHAGMMGGSMQQLNHGISTGALFLLVGLLYERRHTRMFKEFGGLKAQMPIYAAIFLIIMLSSVGLPGTNGFIGEFLAMMGAFEASYHHFNGLNLWYAVIAGFGVVLAAVYLLYMFQQVFYGPNNNPENKRLRDIKPWEIAMCGILILFVFWGGFFPNTFLKPMEASLAATRMMAINPAGQRPVWGDLTQEIDGGLNLVAVADEKRALGESPAHGTVIAPANLHIKSAPAKTDEAIVAGESTTPENVAGLRAQMGLSH
jgi:NADH-quinone oxidoreductase subunit M